MSQSPTRSEGERRLGCAVEGCEQPPGVIVGPRIFCEEHANAFRCATPGCDCWASASVNGVLFCAHCLMEYRKSPHDRTPTQGA